MKSDGLENEFRASSRSGFFVPLDSAVEWLSALEVERSRRDKEPARKTVLNHITDLADPISTLSAFGEGSWDARHAWTRRPAMP